MTPPAGPLVGIKVIEIGGIGPGPFCAMLLSDMGAEVIRVDRVDQVKGNHSSFVDPLNRGRRSVAFDLKNADGVATLLFLIEHADVLIEGFRPGVMERLGLSPEVCRQRNPRLIYGRLTGWGQDGPYAQAPGHDINYIALAGALGLIGRRGELPTPPLNLVGDYGGGGLLMAFGIAAALVEVSKSGQGQTIDAAMVDGASIMTTVFHGLRRSGQWSDERGTNVLDTGSHFYDVYETSDGKYVSVGAIEPKFYAELVKRINLANDDLPRQYERSEWPVMKERMAAIFRTRTRDEWSQILEGHEVCFAPVLSLDELKDHPHHVARDSFVEVGGIVQPAPAPRFDRTPGKIQSSPAFPGEHTDDVLRDWGVTDVTIQLLRDSAAIA
jgi:alpha-methylacyl-CoA racemase